MNLLTAFICLATLTNLPTSRAAGATVGVKVKAKAKAKTKDPWDSPEDGEAPPAGAAAMDAENEMSPEEQAAMMEQMQRQAAIRRAQKQHAVMKQFMRNFANNMRLAVLADSRGDMPESERQRLMAKAERERDTEMGGPADGGEGGGAPDAAPGPEMDQGGSEDMPAPPRRRSHMLNFASAGRQPAHHRPRHRLLPEAEGIGFPAPEGMAADPEGDGAANDPGMTSPSSEESAESEEAPVPRPQPRRHHLRMLNVAPGERGAEKPSPHHVHGRRQLPPGVVRDEMGRAMPLLFVDSKAEHSGAVPVVHMHWGSAVICGLMYFTMAL